MRDLGKNGGMEGKKENGRRGDGKDRDRLES